MEEMITIDEASRRYRVSQATIWRWRSTGRLTLHRRDGTRRQFVYPPDMQYAIDHRPIPGPKPYWPEEPEGALLCSRCRAVIESGDLPRNFE